MSSFFVFFADNEISLDGMNAWARAIAAVESSSSLQSLSLAGHVVTVKFLGDLLSALVPNSTIENVNLFHRDLHLLSLEGRPVRKLLFDNDIVKQVVMHSYSNFASLSVDRREGEMDCVRKLVYTANFFMLLNSEVRCVAFLQRATRRQLHNTASHMRQEELLLQEQVLDLVLQQNKVEKARLCREYQAHRAHVEAIP